MMQEISVLNKEIDLNCTENYRLSIQISLNGFSFGIKDDMNNEYLVLKTYLFDNNRSEYLIDNIKLIISTNPLLIKRYKSLNIIIETEKKTIIPKEMFSQENMNESFALSHSINADESLFFNLYKDNMVIVFAINTNLKDFINLHFNKANVISSLNPILHYAINKDDEYYSVIINNVPTSYFDIIITNKEKLILFNTYKYIKEIDIAFYILNSLKNLNIDNKECKLIFSGEFHNDSETSNLLRKYISIFENLSIINPNKELRKNIIDLHFANLINAELCE